MPVAEIVSMLPVTELLKVVISKAKQVKEFKPLFEELASTLERLVPIIQEMEMLQKRVDPSGNNELKFLTKTLRRAKKMARECSRVRKYDALNKISCAETIKGINKDFLKFCQLDLPLIQHRNSLRSRSAKMEESSPQSSNIATRDANEQRVLLESFKDKGKGKQVKDQEEDEQRVLLESFKNKGKGKQVKDQEEEDEQRVLLESFKNKGKRKQVKDQEEEDEQRVLLESFKGKGKQVKDQEEEDEQRVLLESFKNKGKGKQVKDQEEDEQRVLLESFKNKDKGKQVKDQEEEDEQRVLLESFKGKGKQVKDQEEEDEQRVLLESFKNKGKGKHVKDQEEDEQRVLLESFKNKDKGKQVKDQEEDEQRVLLESFKNKGKGKQVKDQEDEQLAAAFEESLNMQEIDHQARQKTNFRPRQQEQEQQVILESCKDKGKGKKLPEDEQVAAAIQESLNMEDLSVRRAIKESIYLRQREEEQVVMKRHARELEKNEQISERGRVTNGSSSSTRSASLDEQQILWESFKDNKGKNKAN
ncbi:hypothetical protein N665_0989s0006 [Sinapis alba]|nr:hypothetical protein N665_0989s0006 [Sinapis alba]